MHGSIVFAVSVVLFTLLAAAAEIVADFHVTIGACVRRGRERVMVRNDGLQRVSVTQREGGLL